MLDEGPDAPEGAIFEVRPAADAIVGEIARRIAEEGGAALIVDYGHGETAAGETLQAVRGHAYADPLDAPGEADLTAHVDFARAFPRGLGRKRELCTGRCHRANS